MTSYRHHRLYAAFVLAPCVVPERRVCIDRHAVGRKMACTAEIETSRLPALSEYRPNDRLGAADVEQCDTKPVRRQRSAASLQHTEPDGEETNLHWP